MKYTLDDFARLIDHTNLHADATHADMKKLCDEAKKYHFKMVAINQVQSAFCSKQLAGTDIDTGAAIAFPLGQQSIASKVFDTKDAIKNGANEIDYVINITELKAKNYDYIKDEMTQMVDVCHEHHIPCKVIFENCYLTKDEIKKMAEIAKEVNDTLGYTAVDTNADVETQRLQIRGAQTTLKSEKKKTVSESASTLVSGFSDKASEYATAKG